MVQLNYTACGHRMAHRKWKETKHQPSLLPGPSVPGCSLVSFHFLWAILCPQAVLKSYELSKRAAPKPDGGTYYYRADGVDGPQEMERS